MQRAGCRGTWSRPRPQSGSGLCWTPLLRRQTSLPNWCAPAGPTCTGVCISQRALWLGELSWLPEASAPSRGKRSGCKPQVVWACSSMIWCTRQAERVPWAWTIRPRRLGFPRSLSHMRWARICVGAWNWASTSVSPWCGAPWCCTLTIPCRVTCNTRLAASTSGMREGWT